MDSSHRFASGLVASMVAVMVVAVAALAGCSRNSDEQPTESSGIAIDTQVPSPNGDECTDTEGDVDGVNADDPGVAEALAGIDLVSALAVPNGEVLDVTFKTVGAVSLVPEATFVVAQGDAGGPLSFEIRASSRAGSWQVQVIRWQDTEQRRPADADVTVSGNELRFAVPLDDLPPIAKFMQFGTYAPTPSGSMAIDQCSGLTPSTAPHPPTTVNPEDLEHG